MMRGRPSPFLSLALAVWLLVPAALGGADDGPEPPTVPGTPTEPLERHAEASSHHPLSDAPSTDTSPYVDLVATFRPGDSGAAKSDPKWALGTPGVTSVGLGRDGCLLLAFTDLAIPNHPQDPRADLRIYEDQNGYPEYATLDVSADGVRFERYGLVNGDTGDIDLAERIDTRDIRFLRFTDAGANVYSTTATSGYDLRGVRALVYDANPDATLGLVEDTGIRAGPCEGPF